MNCRDYIAEQKETAQAKIDIAEGGLIGMVVGMLLLVGLIAVGCLMA